MLRNKQKLLGVLIISVAIASILSLRYFSPLSGSYVDITVEQAKELIEANPSLVVLDVRTEEEFHSERIEGAKNIPVDDLEIRLTKLNPNDKILVYCRTGNRSTQAAKILVQNGFSDFYHMVGGIVSWIQAGYPTIQ